MSEEATLCSNHNPHPPHTRWVPGPLIHQIEVPCPGLAAPPHFTAATECHCVDVEMGSYDNQVSMLAPFDLDHRDDRWVCIDTCIATEIGWLWHQGIKTLGSCCGHQIRHADVIVAEEHYDQMDALGYHWKLLPSGLRGHHLRSGSPCECRDQA